MLLMASIFRLTTACIGILLATTAFLQQLNCQVPIPEHPQHQHQPPQLSTLAEQINQLQNDLLTAINYYDQPLTSVSSSGRTGGNYTVFTSQLPERTHLIALQNVKTLAVIELRQLPAVSRSFSPYLRFFAAHHRQPQHHRELFQLRDCTLFDMIKRKEEGEQFLERLANASIASGGNTTFYAVPFSSPRMLLNATQMCRLLWKYQEQPAGAPEPAYTLADLFSSFSRYLPGTQWCGPGDRAVSYWDLGTKAEVDSCCREHDHCPVRLASRESAYGEVNSREFTTSWCECDQRFKQCLDESGTDVGQKVWTLFAYFQAGCLERIHPHHGNGNSLCREKRLTAVNDTLCDEQFRIRVFPAGQR
ncbi:hypothetical protein TYRP_001325 [Tyrophagus putrescentiae]|nr:hypothetical protein TYRP_001325 [Tyrophagus putrescentiae]